MGLLKNFQVFKQRIQDAILRRYENTSNYLHTLSWLNIAIVLNLFFGIVFLALGLVLLTGREENNTVGWIFFAISLCTLLLGLFLLIVRCMFPVKSLPTRQPRRRPRRPNRIYEARPRPHPGSSQRVSQATPSPIVWSTPANDLDGQTMAQFIAQMNFENAQRSPVTLQAPPPTYEQAIGRTTNSSGVQPERLDSQLPPPYQADGPR